MKQLLAGNGALILCAAFYLAWWVLAFKPEGAVKGLKSGWLLLPAVAFGVLALVLICEGISLAPDGAELFPPLSVAGAGAFLYILLLVATGLLMKRPVTAELFLIVGWATLAVCEAGALLALGGCGRPLAFALVAAHVLMFIISLVCYLLYYKLDEVKGWYDGMVPLAFVLLSSVAFCLAIVTGGSQGG